MDLIQFGIWYNNPARWNIKSCIYEGTDKSCECSFDSHQIQAKSENVALMGTGTPPMQFAAYVVCRDSRNGNARGFQSIALGGVCWFHAESDPNAAFLAIADKANVDISQCEVFRFVKDEIKTFEELNVPEPRLDPQFNPGKYERDNADAKSVVQFGGAFVKEADSAHDKGKQEADAPSMFIDRGDRRCIFQMEKCGRYKCVCHEGCRNTEQTPSGFGVRETEMPLPAYIVYHKNHRNSGPIGNICYHHAVTLQSALRRIADKATRDGGQEVTLDDLHIDIHWNSNGHKPSKYTEKAYLVEHVLDPDWKPTDPLCNKWKTLKGNTGTCRLCNHQYLVPFSMDYTGILPKEVLEAPDYFYVGLYCCRECQEKIQARGCGGCGTKLTKDNTWSGTVDFRDNEKMFCTKCYKCQSCGSQLTPWGLGLSDEEQDAKSYKELCVGNRADRKELRINTGGTRVYDTYRKCNECYEDQKKQGNVPFYSKSGEFDWRAYGRKTYGYY